MSGVHFFTLYCAVTALVSAVHFFCWYITVYGLTLGAPNENLVFWYAALYGLTAQSADTSTAAQRRRQSTRKRAGIGSQTDGERITEGEARASSRVSARAPDVHTAESPRASFRTGQAATPTPK